MTEFPNCWEVKNCGRQKGGAKVAELGECVASMEGLGHSCWAIAGTLCGGAVQGTVAQKESNCMRCSQYQDFNRATGVHRKEIVLAVPDEERKYAALLLNRYKPAKAI